MNTIFKRNDFLLCKVPVIEGYKQSQTHAGIAIHAGDVYLTTSPYPNCKQPQWKVYGKAALNKLHLGMLINTRPAEQFENPCLYIGYDKSKEGIPCKFKLLQSTPLMPPPDPYYGLPAFNSDPDIYIEDNEIHILNRVVYRVEMHPNQHVKKYNVRLFHIYGDIDEKRFKYKGTELLHETDQLFISPCMTKFNGKYLLTQLDTNAYNDGHTFQGLYIAKGQDISDFKQQNLEWKKVEIESNGMLPWHMSLFQNEGILYTIMACIEKGKGHRCWQMLGVFNKELTELKICKTPLTDYKSYRGAAYVSNTGEFVLYNTTVGEKLPGGKSIDGREVITAHMPFGKLMDRIKE